MIIWPDNGYQETPSHRGKWWYPWDGGPLRIIAIYTFISHEYLLDPNPLLKGSLGVRCTYPIIPFSKWLITMVIVGPATGEISPSKWRFMA